MLRLKSTNMQVDLQSSAMRMKEIKRLYVHPSFFQSHTHFLLSLIVINSSTTHLFAPIFPLKTQRQINIANDNHAHRKWSPQRANMIVSATCQCILLANNRSNNASFTELSMKQEKESKWPLNGSWLQSHTAWAQCEKSLIGFLPSPIKIKRS